MLRSLTLALLLTFAGAAPQAVAADNPAAPYIVFIDGIHSAYPSSSDFDDARSKLETNGFRRFVYFSYAAAGDGPNGSDRPGFFYCTGWGSEACDGSGGTPDSGNLISIYSPPIYTQHDTEQPIDRQVAALDSLLGQIIHTDPAAHVEIIGFSLGGIVATRWAVLHDALSETGSHVQGLVTIDSPVGGIPLAGPVEGSLLAGLAGLLFGDHIAHDLALGGDGSIVDSLQSAADAYSLTLIENTQSVVTNGASIWAVIGPPFAECQASLIGTGAGDWLGTAAHPTMRFNRDNLGGSDYTSNSTNCFGVPEALSIIWTNHLASLTSPRTADWVLESTQADSARVSGSVRGATYSDDFSQYQAGTTPGGRIGYGSPRVVPKVVQFGGSGKAFQRLEFPGLGGGRTDKWLIYDQVYCAEPSVTVKLTFRTTGDAAGVVFGWSGPDSRVSVIPNMYWGMLQFYEFVHGTWRTRVETGSGTLPLRISTDYWLRVKTTAAPDGTHTATVLWSTDGSFYRQIFVSGPLVTVAGQVGLQTQGENLPDVLFDDFVVDGSC